MTIHANFQICISTYRKRVPMLCVKGSKPSVCFSHMKLVLKLQIFNFLYILDISKSVISSDVCAFIIRYHDHSRNHEKSLRRPQNHETTFKNYEKKNLSIISEFKMTHTQVSIPSLFSLVTDGNNDKDKPWS